MTKQPKWTCIANLGDASPIEHGGCFVFTDDTNVYSAEMEVWFPGEEVWDEDDPNVDDDGTKGTAYRIMLDRCEFLHFQETGEEILIPFSIWEKAYVLKEELPYSIKKYKEWFSDRAIALNIQAYITSDDPVDRAVGYRELCEYAGYYTFDQYPLKLTEEEARERYTACNAIVEGA